MPAKFPACAFEVDFVGDSGAHQAAYFAQVMADAPLLYLRFGAIVDSSRYARSPTAAGSPASGTPGPITGDTGSGYLIFDGVNDVVDVPDAVELRLTTLITLESWFWQSTSALGPVVGKGNSTGSPNYLLEWRRDGTTDRFSVYNGTGWIDGPAFTFAASTWMHVAATFDGATWRFYHNGALAGTVASAVALATSTDAAHVGVQGSTAGSKLTGRLAEVCIYAYPLSAERVKAHYDARTATYPVATAPSAITSWSNLSGRVKSFGTRRGRQHELGRFEPGTARVRADNTDRALEPEYAGDLFNYVTNPGFEIDIAGWSVFNGGTRSRVTTEYLFGQASLQVVAAASVDGVVTAVSGLVPGQTYVFSFYAKVAVGETVAALIESPTGTSLGSTGGIVGDGTWQRVSGSFVAGAGGTASFYPNSSTGAQTFYLDGAQCEPGAAATAFVNGDFDNARWQGTRHASRTFWGGPYYPNLVSMRRGRLRAAWPPQMVANGGFEIGTTASWTAALAGAATQSVTTGDALSAPGCTKRWEATSPAGGGTDYAALLSAMIPVDPRKVYTLTAKFFKTAAGATVTILRAVCYDDEGNLLGYTYPTITVPGATLPGAGGNFNIASASAWLTYGGALGGDASSSFGGTGFLPGTKYAAVEIYAFYNPTTAYTGTVRVDCVALTPGNGMFPDADYYINTTDGYDANDAWQEIFNGFVENWELDWPNRRHGITDVGLVDGFEPLAMENLSAPLPVQLSGARVHSVLDAAGWSQTERSIQAGQSLVQADDFGNNLTEPANHLAEVYETEGGVFFIGKDGKAVFLDRQDRISGGSHALSVATFGDGGPSTGEMPYTEIEPSFDLDRVFNRVRVSPKNLATQEANDVPSQKKYWRRLLSITTLHTTVGEASSVASVLLARYKDQAFRFDSIGVEPRRDAKIWPHVLRRETSDRITVVRRPQATTNALVRAVHIEAITHDVEFSPKATWKTRLQLSPADTNVYWVLDTALLDTGTRLGF